MVAGLKEGGLYRFRVKAVNAAGVGDPGFVSELIETKDRTSKNLVHLRAECVDVSSVIYDDMYLFFLTQIILFFSSSS